MKSLKKLCSVILTLALFVTLFSSSAFSSEAATKSVAQLKKAIPSKVRIYPNSEYTSNGVKVYINNDENYITNIKTSSKNLKAKVAYKNYYSSSEDNYASIGLYATKEGTYKLSFDVFNKKGGKKLFTKKVTVYAKADAPFKSIKYAGSSNLYDIQKKASGKLSVKLNKGYKLKSIEVGTYSYIDQVDKNETSENSVAIEKKYSTELKYKKVKNNAKITLGTIPSSYYNYRYENEKNDYSSYLYVYKSLSSDLIANTNIRITYIDKYTKEEVTTSYTIRRFAK